MQYGITLPNTGAASDPRIPTELAIEAEQAGWDGVFLWDCISVGETKGEAVQAAGDPWITLAAIATQTRRIRFGPMVTPLSRRRPWKVARETVSLDYLSGGRLILPVGLGAINDGGYANVGEIVDRKARAQMLDEALAILTGLWSGQPFSFHGEHYQVEEMTFLPTPLQQPRIPIWVVGAWPRMKSMRRVLRCDGVLPSKMQEDGTLADMTPDDLQAMQIFLASHGKSQTPFDIVMEGETPGDDGEQARSIVRPLAEAGVTWWLEAVWGTPETTGGVEGMRTRIRQGPAAVMSQQKGKCANLASRE
jgi:alkanesulfonate monooxygenase SsuD/methylene tetrahydromethanopterin reductase-like flavin-dependent oxidoreductase (luciferase family)